MIRLQSSYCFGDIRMVFVDTTCCMLKVVDWTECYSVILVVIVCTPYGTSVVVIVELHRLIELVYINLQLMYDYVVEDDDNDEIDRNPVLYYKDYYFFTSHTT